MRINQNVPALNAYRNMVMTDNRLNKSLERLSSGLRINRAADDAAGLAISEKMRGQIRGLNQASRNAQDAISLIQTAEGALNETHSILQRMRELSVQAASDTLTSSDRMEIQKEITQLTAEIDRIGNTTEFNTKNLLDGTTSALTSTDKLKTKVFMRDGLRVIDQFGQKAVEDGNFKLKIDATPGASQVQKTDIMRIKHPGATVNVTRVEAGAENANAVHTLDFSGAEGGTFRLSYTNENTEEVTETTDINFTTDAGVLQGRINDALDAVGVAGHVVAAGGDIAATTITFSGASVQNTPYALAITQNNLLAAGTPATNTYVDGTDSLTISGVGSGAGGNIAIAFNQDTVSSLGASFDGSTLTIDFHGTQTENTATNVHLGIRALGVENGVDFSRWTATGTGNFNNATGYDADSIDGDFAAPDPLANGVNGAATSASVALTTAGAADQNEIQTISIDGAKGGSFRLTYTPTFGASQTTGLIAWDAAAPDIKAALEGLAGIDGVNVTGVEGGAWTIEFTNPGNAPQSLLTVDTTDLAGAEEIGDIAKAQSSIYDVERFWDASGNFLVEKPETIQVIQGDGSKTSITIFKTDTIADIESKLNDAIHNGLGQSSVDGTSSTGYAQYVGPGDKVDNSFFSVEGTFIIQSAVTGKDGEITFVGDDRVINALSLTTIQQSSESLYSVTVTDAHDDSKVIVADEKISGNTLIGKVHKNVDVKFDAMADILFSTEAKVGAGKTFAQFSFAEDTVNEYTTYVHIADNSQVFHIGANPLQDIDASVGDMRAEALGIENIMVTNRAAANSAIATVDNAIGKVSSERSKLGAIQNRLEHTINNLGVAAENLTAAESRIRDLDFAMEMIEFTRNQIMMQAGTSMLAQANMKPQSVLMLLG